MPSITSKDIRRRIAVALFIASAAACASSSDDATTHDAGADAKTNDVVDASMNGVCCPIDLNFQGCAGTHQPGGWAPTAADCSDPSILYGAGRYLSVMTNSNRCPVLVEFTPPGAAQCEAGAGADDAGAPVGGGVCCRVDSIPCEGGFGGGWAARPEACLMAGWPMDTAFIAYPDAHGCLVNFQDFSVCTCECQPDASLPVLDAAPDAVQTADAGDADAHD